MRIEVERAAPRFSPPKEAADDGKDDDPRVLDKIIKETRKHGVRMKVHNLLCYFDRIHSAPSSFLKNGFSFDETELSYWLSRLFDKTEWPARHPFLRALMRGVGIYYRVIISHVVGESCILITEGSPEDVPRSCGVHVPQVAVEGGYIDTRPLDRCEHAGQERGLPPGLAVPLRPRYLQVHCFLFYYILFVTSW